MAILHALHQMRPEIVFIQVGSNDTDEGDPLAPFLRERTWSGVLIEPVPYIFERLVQKHGNSDRLRFENVAIASEAGERPFFYLAESSDDLPVWYDQLGSFSQEIILTHTGRIRGLRERIVEMTVQCRTFDSVCDSHGIHRLDMIHIDTEGADYDILRTVDLDRFQPAVLIYEHVHLPSGDREAARSQVRAAGYEWVAVAQDDICVRTEALDDGSPLREVWRHVTAQSGT